MQIKKTTICFVYYEDEVVFIGKTKRTCEAYLKSKVKNDNSLDACKITKIKYHSFESSADALLYYNYFINKFKPRFNHNYISQGNITAILPPLDFSVTGAEQLTLEK